MPLARLSGGLPPIQAGLLMAMGQIPIDDWSRRTLLEGIKLVVGLYWLAPARRSTQPANSSCSGGAGPGPAACLDRQGTHCRPARPRMARGILTVAGTTLLRVELPGTVRVVEFSDTEITVAQLGRLMPDHPTFNVLGHDSENPACYVNFDPAATFCNCHGLMRKTLMNEARSDLGSGGDLHGDV